MPDSLPFGKDAKPDYRQVEKRRPLSKWEFATLMLQQQGKCQKCDARLQRGKVRDEHLHALHLGGGNELTNRALWCLDCTKPKDAKDKAAIAKGKRIRGETGTGPKKAIPSRGFGRMPEGRDPKRWQSAGFNKSLRRKMNGKIEKVEP
jgi:5-methylcytosine-specific restriction endonuclease McrA